MSREIVPIGFVQFVTPGGVLVYRKPGWALGLLACAWGCRLLQAAGGLQLAATLYIAESAPTRGENGERNVARVDTSPRHTASLAASPQLQAAGSSPQPPAHASSP